MAKKIMAATGGKRLNFIADLNTGPLKAGAVKAKAIVGGLGQSISKISPFGSLGMGAAGVGLAAGAMFAKITKDAYSFSNDFSKAMREVQTISEATQADFDGIGDAIINIAANEAIDDAKGLAEAYYQIVSAGKDGAEGLELLAVSSRAAIAGISDTKTAADGLTTVLNAWGLATEKATGVSDVMFQTVKLGKTTFGELSSSIAQVAPFAASLGVPFEEISAAIATITKQGTPTAMAITQIRGALIAMNENLGDGWAGTMSLQEGFAKVRDMAGGSDIKLQKMMGRVEGMNAVLALTGDKAKMAAEDLAAMYNASGAAATAYETMMLEADNIWAVTHNKWNRSLKTFGSNLKVASIGVADIMNIMMTHIGDVDLFAATNDGIDGFMDRWRVLKGIGAKGLGGFAQALFTSDEGINEDLQEIYSKDLYKGTLKGKSVDELKIDKAAIKKEIDKAYNEFLSLSDRQDKNSKELSATILKDFTRMVGYKEAINESIRALQPGSKTFGGGSSVDEPKSRIDAENEIKALQEQMGKDVELDIHLSAKIANEEEFINDWDLKINTALRKTLKGNEIDLTPMVGRKLEKGTIGGEVKGQLKTMKTLTKEQVKQLTIEDKKLQAIQKQKQLIEDTSKVLYEGAEILGALSFATKDLNAGLSESLGSMADIAHNALTMIENIGKDPLGAITSGISLIGNLISMFTIDNEIKEINEDLYTTVRLMSVIGSSLDSLDSNSWFKQANILMDGLNSKIREFVDGKAIFGTFGQTDLEFILGWYQSVAEIQGGLSEGQEEAMNEFIEWNNQLNQLREEASFRRLGFDTGTVADSIFTGVKDGLELAGGELGDWTDNFGVLLRKSLSQSIIAALNDKFLVEFMKEFNLAMADGELSPDEIDNLKDLYRMAIEQTENAYDAVSPIFEDAEQIEQSGLEGAIRGITEETAGLIAGQFTAMRVSLSNMDTTFEKQTEFYDEMLGLQQDIAGNTAHLYRLEEIEKAVSLTAALIEERL